MRDHRDLEVWQKAMDLAAEMYELTALFPPAERYGLCSQMRRAAVSVPSNIAEGAGRRTTKDFLAFVHMARGSLAELETQALLASRIGLPSQSAKWQPRVDEVGRLLNGLIRALHQKNHADGQRN
jgi:four helix bundle protein